MWLFQIKNEKLKKEVQFCKAEVNAMTKQVEDNLRKIASSALVALYKENGELKVLGR